MSGAQVLYNRILPWGALIASFTFIALIVFSS